MSSLWLITTYFNPLGWRSRRDNYHTFRRHLDARLLTVSWSPEGNHELEEGDADILIRVDGGDLMWQKERLINIGLAHLPDDCDLVGWVDCDILFQEPSWQQQAIALLRAHQVIQAWCTAEDPNRQILDHLQMREALTKEGQYSPQSDEHSAGLAWAAQRTWLEAMGGLPDRAIIGGGARDLACALLGCWEAYAASMQRRGLGRYCSEQSRQWAQKAQSSAPHLGCLDGTILHLHHGDLVDRSYLQRQFDLLRTGFLPDGHLERDLAGAWRFNDAAPAQTRQLMAGYFRSRREDGTEAAI